MQDLIEHIITWEQSGRSFAVATVIATWRSAPRSVGASMIIAEDLTVIGSVSGGCIEGQVIKSAQKVLKTGRSELMKFGISNEEAWSVGLSCGGGIEVFVQPFIGQAIDPLDRDIWRALRFDLLNNKACLMATVLDSSTSHLFIDRDDAIGDFANAIGKEALQSVLDGGKSMILSSHGRQIFAQVFPAKDRLIIIGASHLSYDLVKLAQAQGFSVTVIDPRGIFSESLASICSPEQLITGWPAEELPQVELDKYVYAAVLTHDPKIDDQALQILLKADIAYVGALGSKKTQHKRCARLQEAGLSDQDIAQLHGPIGLDIGATSPAQIALSIMAQIIEVKNQEST